MDSLTSAQLSEWEAYDRIDPIGTWRDDFRIAVFEALVLNIAQKVHSDPKKGVPKDVSPMDFMPDWLGERKQKGQSVEEMKQILMSFAESQNKKVNKRVRQTTRKPVKKDGKHRAINSSTRS